MKKISKICPICSIAFEVPYSHRQRYITCSYICGGIYRTKPRAKTICEFCKIEFIQKRRRKIPNRFCSNKCNQASRSYRTEFVCHYCKLPFTLPPNLINRRKNNERKYCSRSCVLKDWNEKSIKREMPGSYRSNAWKVYEKKCYDCGLTDERILVIHHIDGNRKNGVLTNLIPVCHNCHCIRHIELSGNHRLPSVRRYKGAD
jgi:hypothetical protein